MKIYFILLDDFKIQSKGIFEIKSIRNQVEMYFLNIKDLFTTKSPV